MNVLVRTANLVDLIVQDDLSAKYPLNLLPEIAEKTELLAALRRCAQIGEIEALSSTLKLNRKTKLRLCTPATRLVLNFMVNAIKTRAEMLHALEVFNFPQEMRDGCLVEKCKFRPEQLVYKDVPEFTEATSSIWWKKVVKPYLERPETLNSVARNDPRFYGEITQAAMRAGSSKDFQIKDELKKRCQAALINLAKDVQSHFGPSEMGGSFMVAATFLGDGRVDATRRDYAKRRATGNGCRSVPDETPGCAGPLADAAPSKKACC